MKLLASIIGGLAASAVSSAGIPHVVHERRAFLTSEWVERNEKLDPGSMIPFSIALKQQNIGRGPDFLSSVSDPGSPNYGKHWSSQEVIDRFASSKATIDTVKSWLLSEGIKSNRVAISGSRNWLRFNASISEAERLLKTKYSLYEHSETGQNSLACREYSLPQTVQNHVDFVTPTVQLSQVTTKARRQAVRSNNLSPDYVGPVDLNSSPPISSWDLTYCNNYTTPACLKALYNIPNGTLSLSTIGVVEFAPYATYYTNDLEIFLQGLGQQVPNKTAPNIQLIDTTSYQNNSYDLSASETILDISLTISLVYPLNVTIVAPLDDPTGSQLGTDAVDWFLEALDATYCDVVALDESAIAPGKCGGSTSPSVLSISYSGREDPDLTPQYIRQCNEFMKLGLQGITIIYSTGDNGVESKENTCCNNPGCVDQPQYDNQNFNSSAAYFFPSYPASCPWVTTVGGTRVAAGGSVHDPEVGANDVLHTANGFTTQWSGGGGFSNVFPMPDYQKDALGEYYKTFKPNYTGGIYNDTQLIRGYPDLAANAVNTLIVKAGQWFRLGGTSAAVPIVASIITLINEQRIKAGKSTVGFINPVLYKNANALNDIISGNNPGCGTPGFQAVKGWDPVTGLGTPDYEKLLQVWMALP